MNLAPRSMLIPVSPFQQPFQTLNLYKVSSQLFRKIIKPKSDTVFLYWVSNGVHKTELKDLLNSSIIPVLPPFRPRPILQIIWVKPCTIQNTQFEGSMTLRTTYRSTHLFTPHVSSKSDVCIQVYKYKIP